MVHHGPLQLPNFSRTRVSVQRALSKALSILVELKSNQENPWKNLSEQMKDTGIGATKNIEKYQVNQ